MSSTARLNASYVDHVTTLEQRLSTDAALRHAVGGEFIAIGQLEYQLLRSRGLKDGHLVVDVGCGSGRLACQLAPFPAIRYLGTDVAPRLLDYARELCARPDWQFVHTNGTTIPCADTTADFVTFFSVFTHLPQEQIFRYLREAHRVLKPGGLVIMSFLEFRVPLHWATFIASVDGTRDDDHLNQFIERDSIQVWANTTGFEIRGLHGGDTEYIPITHEIRFENGTRMNRMGSLGQSVAILQKSLPAATTTPAPAAPANLSAPATSSAPPAILVNLSSRTRLAAGGSSVLGFTLRGEGERPVLVRAVGPGLSAFGVPDPLPQPLLEIYAGNTLRASAGAWAGRAELVDAIRAAHAFSLAPDSADAVLLTRLPPGSYTAVVRGATPDAAGEALLEVYLP